MTTIFELHRGSSQAVGEEHLRSYNQELDQIRQGTIIPANYTVSERLGHLYDDLTGITHFAVRKGLIDVPCRVAEFVSSGIHLATCQPEEAQQAGDRFGRRSALFLSSVGRAVLTPLQAGFSGVAALGRLFGSGTVYELSTQALRLYYEGELALDRCENTMLEEVAPELPAEQGTAQEIVALLNQLPAETEAANDEPPSLDELEDRLNALQNAVQAEPDNAQEEAALPLPAMPVFSYQHSPSQDAAPAA